MFSILCWSFVTREIFYNPEAEYEEFEQRFKFKLRLKYGIVF